MDIQVNGENYERIVFRMYVQVNGQSLLGVDHQEAVRILRGVTDRMIILVCDGDAATPSQSSPSPLTPTSLTPSSELPSPDGAPVTPPQQGQITGSEKNDEEAGLRREVSFNNNERISRTPFHVKHAQLR